MNEIFYKLDKFVSESTTVDTIELSYYEIVIINEYIKNLKQDKMFTSELLYRIIDSLEK